MVHDLILKVQLFLSELSAKAGSPHFLEQLLIIQPESTASDTYGRSTGRYLGTENAEVSETHTLPVLKEAPLPGC